MPRKSQNLTASLLSVEGQLEELVEIAQAPSTPARERLAALAAIRELKHIEAPRPPKARPRIPSDPIEALKLRLRDVRSRLPAAEGIAYVQLVQVERSLVDEIRAEEERRKPVETLTPAQLLAQLVEDLPSWSDDELLAVHAEGIRRGIPGFGPR